MNFFWRVNLNSWNYKTSKNVDGCKDNLELVTKDYLVKMFTVNPQIAVQRRRSDTVPSFYSFMGGGGVWHIVTLLRNACDTFWVRA